MSGSARTHGMCKNRTPVCSYTGIVEKHGISPAEDMPAIIVKRKTKIIPEISRFLF
jgi:hypothetical protein